MRTIFLMIVLLSAVAIKAQTVIPAGILGFRPGMGIANNIYPEDILSKKKWSFSRYSGISTSFTFFNGGYATIVSAPLGLQLNRMLSNNLYAFANITVAPSYVNFDHSFMNAGAGKTYPGGMFSVPNRLGVYSAASMGLMYINNEKTFSISGSISIERSNISPLLVYPTTTSMPTSFSPANR